MKNSIESIYAWYRSVIRNPKYRWWIILGTFVYLLSPIDIAPDFLPIVGWIDDGIIASLLVAELSQILLERLKSGQNSQADQGIPANAATSNANTVEVNAVELE